MLNMYYRIDHIIFPKNNIHRNTDNLNFNYTYDKKINISNN